MLDLIHNAQYKEQIISEYKGNPFIEALPQITSSEEVVSKLANFPPYNKEERQLDNQYRAHLCVFRIIRTVFPGVSGQ